MSQYPGDVRVVELGAEAQDPPPLLPSPDHERVHRPLHVDKLLLPPLRRLVRFLALGSRNFASTERELDEMRDEWRGRGWARVWGEAGSPQLRRGQGEAGPGQGERLRRGILPDERGRLLPHQGRRARWRLGLGRLGHILLLEEPEQPRDGLRPHLLLHGVSLQQPRPLSGEQELLGGQFEGRGLPLAGHGAWWCLVEGRGATACPRDGQLSTAAHPHTGTHVTGHMAGGRGRGAETMASVCALLKTSFT